MPVACYKPKQWSNIRIKQRNSKCWKITIFSNHYNYYWLRLRSIFHGLFFHDTFITYRRKKLKAKLKFVSRAVLAGCSALFFFPHGNFITLQSADWLFYLGSQKIEKNLPGASKVASFRF